MHAKHKNWVLNIEMRNDKKSSSDILATDRNLATTSKNLWLKKNRCNPTVHVVE